MRFIFLIPDLRRGPLNLLWRALEIGPTRRLLPSGLPGMSTGDVSGGALNIMRHTLIARSLGADAVLATAGGKDTYGLLSGLQNPRFIRWSDRRPEDVCIVPDIYTHLISSIEGFAIAFQQSPLWLRLDFDYMSKRVGLWTVSPRMVELCRAMYPGKELSIVPNVIDGDAFPFVPQSDRREGELIAFPRKGREFIEKVYHQYTQSGGSFWHLELIHGLSWRQVADRFRTPQAFLASADLEGCAFPPLEAMASGIVVVGKDAQGANFYMRHQETALVANTVNEAVGALRSIEVLELRERLSRGALASAANYFPDAEPTAFWKRFLAERSWE